MPKVSVETASQGGDHGPVNDRAEELEGGYTVNFVEFREDIDATEMLKGLPDDRCQCPHWGYVLEGRMTMQFPEGEETYEAGDAFYAPAGHVPVKHEPGTRIVQFSPTDELHKTQEVLMRNFQQAQAAQ